MAAEEKKIALLIDADNVSAKYLDNIFTELSKYGKVTIRRMYGDWSEKRLKGWLQYSAKYSLVPVMQLNDTPGKNASDIGLIIETMDFLYTDDVDIFCIASSDGDFNRLAKRIRESGKMIIGMGEKKTPEAFRNSCERFIFLDIADEEEVTEIEVEEQQQNKNITSKGKTNVEDIINSIFTMLSETTLSGDPTGLGEIGSRLDKIYPDFDVRNYGYSKLSGFLRGIEGLDIAEVNNSLWVSVKISPVEKVEQAIRGIFEQNKIAVINVGELKKLVTKKIPDLEASISQTGVTRFYTYLKKLPFISVEDNIASLIEEKTEK